MSINKKSITKVLSLSFLIGCVSSCSSGYNYSNYGPYVPPIYTPVDANTEGGDSYLPIDDNYFVDTTKDNTQSLSLDSSTGSYTKLRSEIERGRTISKDQVVIEEMLNYFKYDDYIAPTDEAIGAYTEVHECPWNPDHALACVAIKTRDYIMPEEPTANNYVFLLDVSGSMYDDLELVKNAMLLLLENLQDDDYVSIVTYASGVRTILDGARGDEKMKIQGAITDLTAGGSTNGSGGIQLAYSVANKHFIEGGNNRVFLATDGDFNVGISTIDSLKNFISNKRETGVYLSVLGFGYGNTKNDTMSTLAMNGNGNYYYIDSILEAQKVFIEELGGTLETVAKDTKAQVIFDKDKVKSFRMIGYENRTITDEEFNNDETDAGEMGAGHTSIVLFELSLIDMENTDELFTVQVKYKDPKEADMNKTVTEVGSYVIGEETESFLFASAVCESALVMRQSSLLLLEDASIAHALSRINDLDSVRNDPYKTDFIQLMLKYLDNTTK